MITEEVLKAILAGREFRRSEESGWRKYTPDPNGKMFVLDLNADYELRPLPPVFEHWHGLSIWTNQWLAMDENGRWCSYDTEPIRLEESGIWGGDYATSIPSKYWPKWTGDWRESKIQRPADLGGVWVTREKIDEVCESACNKYLETRCKVAVFREELKAGLGLAKGEA